MKNSFKKNEGSFHSSTGETLTPYQRARQEWDTRIGTARVQAKNWRILALGSVLTSLLLIVILTLVLVSRREHIYIAEVTKEGRVVNVAPLIVKYHPTEAQKKFFIANFIELTRSIPLDPVLAKKNWLSAYDLVTSRGAETLNKYFKEGNPVLALGKKTISINILGMEFISPTTLHVDWEEVSVNANGQEEYKKYYSGVFTIIIKQPSKEREIMRNPLGMYVADFNLSIKKS